MGTNITGWVKGKLDYGYKYITGWVKGKTSTYSEEYNLLWVI